MSDLLSLSKKALGVLLKTFSLVLSFCFIYGAFLAAFQGYLNLGMLAEGVEVINRFSMLDSDFAGFFMFVCLILSIRILWLAGVKKVKPKLSIWFIVVGIFFGVSLGN